MKNLTLLIAALLTTFGLSLGGASVFADEVDCIATPDADACITTTSDEDNIMPISEPITEDPVEGTETPINDVETPSDGSTDIVVDETEEIIEEETEPALWPMYVSLGALGAAILVFIVLNLFGGKKK